MAMPELLSRLQQFWTVERDKPELLKAQYKAFSSKIPMMYFILVVNSWALALTHIHTAPRWLSLYYPMALTLLCILRFISWRRSRHTLADAERAWRALTRTNRLTVPIAISFTVWAVLLFPYGDDYAHAHVAFYMGITVISCIFCLMYLRSAALTVALIVNGTFTVFFLATDIPTFIAAAINVVLVTAAMLVVMNSHYVDFRRLVDAQVATAALSNENLRLANLDALTQIPNRRKFFAQLDRTCERARARNERFAVAILDLDGFKSINDLYGHSVGDKLLVQVGQRLQELCTDDIHLARLGGDEFALIFEADLDNSQLLAFGKQVCTRLRSPFFLQSATVQVAASIGVATFPDMAADAITLYEHADYALYHGKRNNRGAINLFSADDRNQIQTNAIIEQALRQADFERELAVHFQPIVDLQHNTVVAFEALARWTSPLLGPVSPAQFIPAAERMGIIGQQTRILLSKALATAATWPEQIRLSFNLSANDLNSADGVANLIEIIQQANFDPRRLDLEITETATLHDMAQAKHATDLLRGFGCGITLDDFGTGYSSLSQLHALPLTRIKIDRSFVTGIDHNPISYKIVKSLLALSRDMNLACVVEGVETPEEMHVVQELGSQLVQGYLFSKPMPAAATAGWTPAGAASPAPSV